MTDEITKRHPFCNHLLAARAVKRPIVLRYSPTQAGTESAAHLLIVNEMSRKQPFKSLNQLLPEDQGKDGSPNWYWTPGQLLAWLARRPPQPPEDEPKFQRAHARRLQYLLAQSLLYFYKTSWLTNMWTFESIMFFREEARYNFKRPCYPRSLETNPEENRVKYHDPKNLDPPAAAKSFAQQTYGDFMDRFGLLLLQIECHHQLPLSKSEQDDDRGYSLALDRYLKKYEEDIERPIRNVIQKCLDFNGLVAGLPRHHPLLESDEMRFRIVFCTEILLPLREFLVRNWIGIATEVKAFTPWGPGSRQTAHPAQYKYPTSLPPELELKYRAADQRRGGVIFYPHDRHGRRLRQPREVTFIPPAPTMASVMAQHVPKPQSRVLSVTYSSREFSLS